MRDGLSSVIQLTVIVYYICMAPYTENKVLQTNTQFTVFSFSQIDLRKLGMP